MVFNPLLTLKPMVALIDNNKISSFFNLHEIQKCKNVSKVVCFDKTIDALNYLDPLTCILSKPIFVFMTMDMPHINGWEFIERTQKVKGSKEYLHIILLVKQELYIEEEIKINSYSNVSAINAFNMNHEYLDKILTKVFHNNMVS